MSEADAPKSNSSPNSANADGPRFSRWLLVALLAILVLCHLGLVVRLFPSPASLIDDEPVISVDHAIHLYHGYLGARLMRERGMSWGYDPSFMAGYPKTPVYDSSSGPAELFQFLAGGVYSPRAYKIGIAALVALVPMLLAVAARSWGSAFPVITATAAWTVWYWWIGFPDILVRTGLVAFVWSAALAVLLPAIVAAWGMCPSTRWWAAMAGVAAAGVQGHATFVLMALPPIVLGYAVLSFRTSSTGSPLRCPITCWRWHMATWMSVAMALAVTSFWWWPLLRFLSLKTASDIFMKHVGDPTDSVAARVAKFAAGYYLESDARIPLLMVLFGLVGLTRMWRGGRELQAGMLGVQILALSFLTFAGSEWRFTRNLEPLRFQVPLGLSWCVPAGEGLCAILAALAARPRWTTARWHAALLFLLAIGYLTAPVLWWWLPNRPRMNPLTSTWKYSALRIRHSRPLATGLRPEMTELVRWIRDNTDNSQRILFEDQLRLLENMNPEQPESLHWTPLLPMLTGREFIGGLYHLAFIPHQYAAFGDWHLAGQHIRSWSPDRLQAFCEQYNIGWIITWSRISGLKGGDDRMMPLSTDVFATMGFCEPVATLPRHSSRTDENAYIVFRVHRDGNYFTRGRGRVVRAELNRIELADLEPESGELILRYHFQPMVWSDPPLPITRADVGGDPVGFFRILADKPIPRLVLKH